MGVINRYTINGVGGDEHIIADLIPLPYQRSFVGSGMRKNHFIRYNTFYLIITDVPSEIAFDIKGMLYNNPEPVFHVIIHEHNLNRFTSRFREDNYLIGIVCDANDPIFMDKDLFI